MMGTALRVLGVYTVLVSHTNFSFFHLRASFSLIIISGVSSMVDNNSIGGIIGEYEGGAKQAHLFL